MAHLPSGESSGITGTRSRQSRPLASFGSSKAPRRTAFASPAPPVPCHNLYRYYRLPRIKTHRTPHTFARNDGYTALTKVAQRGPRWPELSIDNPPVTLVGRVATC